MAFCLSKLPGMPFSCDWIDDSVLQPMQIDFLTLQLLLMQTSIFSGGGGRPPPVTTASHVEPGVGAAVLKARL